MKITNSHNFPAQVYDAYVKAWTSGDRPTHGISVTELIAPPQQVRLLKERRDEITVDVMDIMAMVDGTRWHAFLQPHAPAGSLVEQRLWMKIEGQDISGQPDLCAGGVLIDHKFTSRWGVILDSGVKPEYEAQDNLYALLLVANGYPEPQALELHLRLHDWSATEAGRSADYPQAPIVVQAVRAWTHEERLAYARERVLLHMAAVPPPCTASERWESPTVYAVMKEGRKSAVKLHEAHATAAAHAAELGPKHAVATRPGVSKRCERYCMARGVCPQYAAMKPIED